MNEEKKEEQVVSEQKASNPINKVKDDIKEVLNQPEQASSVGIDSFIRLSLILVLSALLIFIVWQFMIKPTIDFKNNEKIVEDAARRYYEFNYSQLPTGERVATLSIQQLYDKGYFEAVATGGSKIYIYQIAQNHVIHKIAGLRLEKKMVNINTTHT